MIFKWSYNGHIFVIVLKYNFYVDDFIIVVWTWTWIWMGTYRSPERRRGQSGHGDIVLSKCFQSALFPRSNVPIWSVERDFLPYVQQEKHAPLPIHHFFHTQLDRLTHHHLSLLDEDIFHPDPMIQIPGCKFAHQKERM